MVLAACAGSLEPRDRYPGIAATRVRKGSRMTKMIILQPYGDFFRRGLGTGGGGGGGVEQTAVNVPDDALC